MYAADSFKSDSFQESALQLESTHPVDMIDKTDHLAVFDRMHHTVLK
jgi:hypothetical protein